jgi:SPP1 family predicted phage head-tail adaptor
VVNVKKRKRVFRHKLAIQEYTIVDRNELNQPIMDWVTFATVRGEVDPLRGREYLASRQVQAELTHRVSFRYIKGFKPTMRVAWGEGDGARIFEIESVINPMEQNYEIQLMCKEKVS